MLTSVIGVVVLLGGLIFFHEFGHYLVAKLFRVKVDVFSIGFGKKILRRTLGETEYCLSLFPLGGYVKLLGDDPYKGVPAAEADRAFCTQKLYKRFLIVAAGPLANLILAYPLFVAIFWFGKPMAGTRIGTVNVGSPAWEAGIRPRDHIIEVAGKKVATWSELEDVVRPLEGQKVELSVQRGSAMLRIPMKIDQVQKKNVYGEDELVGGIKGIGLNPLQAMVGVSNPESPAYVAGIRSGDVITKVGTRPVTEFEELNDIFELQWSEGQPITVTVNRFSDKDLEQKAPEEKSFTLVFPKRPKSETLGPLGIVQALGIYPSELVVQQVTPGSPAEKGGLWPHDRIVKINDVPIYNFETIVEQVQATGKQGGAVKLQLERSGQTVVLNLQPVPTLREDPLTRQQVEKYMLGFAPRTSYLEPEITVVKYHEPVLLLTTAVNETNVLVGRMVVSIWKLVAGQISVKNIGGPVLIASVAGKSLDAGIIPFLQMMALISINLFLLNLFPIPILDGGHLLFFLVEGIKGKPVSVRTMEIANQLGMAVILLLVGLTLFNDISRIVMH